ncbi:MAG: hypothetical protein JNJ57_09425 [Saprospiraceae bacterium]|nr:hypothetical protein [Saprospiraceae bacterium]
MKRIYPKRISDKRQLSALLSQYLTALEAASLCAGMKGLAYETKIPEQVFQALLTYQEDEEMYSEVEAADFHIVFANVMIRFPTVKIWLTRDGFYFIEI